MASLVVLPIYFYNDLPLQIPKHYNALGEVDSYGERSIIWLLPTVGLFLYIALTFLTKVPFIYNYPVKVNEKNAERLYKLGVRTIRILKVITVVSFAFLNYKTIAIALNYSTGIGKLYTPIFLTVIVVFFVSIIYKMIKAR